MVCIRTLSRKTSAFGLLSQGWCRPAHTQSLRADRQIRSISREIMGRMSTVQQGDGEDKVFSDQPRGVQIECCGRFTCRGTDMIGWRHCSNRRLGERCARLKPGLECTMIVAPVYRCSALCGCLSKAQRVFGVSRTHLELEFIYSPQLSHGYRLEARALDAGYTLQTPKGSSGIALAPRS